MDSWGNWDRQNRLEIERTLSHHPYIKSYAYSNKDYKNDEHYIFHQHIKDFLWNNSDYLENMENDADYLCWLDELRRYLKINGFAVDENILWMIKNFFEWDDISTLPLEEAVIENYSSKLNLYLVVENSQHISDYLLGILCDKVDLNHILKNQFVGIDFLYDHADKFTQKEWRTIVEKQILTSDFIVEYLHCLDFNHLIERQTINSPKIYEEAIKIGTDIDWDFVVMYQDLKYYIIRRFWNQFDETTQNLIIEHQDLDLKSINFIASKISKNKCADLLVSYLSLKSQNSDYDKIIAKYISKWIYSTDDQNIYKLLDRIAFKFDWEKFIQSGICNYGFVYNEKNQNRILGLLNDWIIKLTRNYNPRTKRKTVMEKRLLESLESCCESNFVHIDVL